MENVTAHAEAYIGTQSRVAQDSNMMYIFLRDSLSEGARLRMANEHEKYDINGTPDGPCYLKAILVTYFVETIATNFVLRQKLQALPDALKQHKYNVSTFNSYVNELVNNLAGGGEGTTDLIVNLFTAYESVKDNAFNTYIAHKKEDYEEGSSDLTPKSLMNLALAKYNLLQTKKTWLKQSMEEEQLVALSAQLKKAKATIDGLAKASTPPATNNDRRTGQGKGHKRYPKWHYENPAGLETMFKDGVTWHWCKWHKCWGRHPDAECLARLKHEKQVAADKFPTTPRKVKKDNKSKNKALSLTKALIAMTNGDDGQESISDEDSS
jgi:hypothetical protein